MSDGLIRSRLKSLGHGETLRRIDRTAGMSHAPFLISGVPEAKALADLTKVIDALLQSLALSRALDELKRDDEFDVAAFSSLKGQRDAMERFIASGEIWSAAAATIH